MKGPAPKCMCFTSAYLIRNNELNNLPFTSVNLGATILLGLFESAVVTLPALAAVTLGVGVASN